MFVPVSFLVRHPEHQYIWAVGDSEFEHKQDVYHGSSHEESDDVILIFTKCMMAHTILEMNSDNIM